MKRIWKAIIAVSILLAVATGALIALNNYEPYNLRSIQADPNAQLLKSLNITKNAIEQGLVVPISDKIAQSLKTGSISLNVKNEDGTQMNGSFYLREDSIAITGHMTFPETEAASYGIWLSADEYVVLLPGTENNTAYGINLSTLPEDLKDSALLNMLNLTYEDAIALFESTTELTPQKEEQTGTDYTAMLEALKQLADISKSATVSVSEGTLTVNAEVIDAYCISYTLAPAQICEALNVVYTWATTTEFYMTATEKNELTNQEMNASFADVKKFITDSNATVVLYFYLNAETQTIAQTTCRIDWMENESLANCTATVKLGADPATSLLYSADISYTPAGGTTDRINFAYHRSHAHNLPGRTLVVSSFDKTMTVMDLQYNSITTAFDLKLMDSEICVTGTYKEDAEQITVELDQQNCTQKTTLIFKNNDSVPELPQYANICDLTEEELNAIASMFPVEPEEDWEIGEPWEDGEHSEKLEDSDAFFDDEVSILICSNTSVGMYSLPIGEYQTIGELLAAEQIAYLDENGRVTNLCDEDFPDTDWEVYINGNLTEENLNEIPLEYGISIEIYSMYNA